MARNDALLKLHERLVSRRRELTGTIEMQLGALRLDQGNNSGDDIDVAATSMNSELTSQLAEHESRELTNIERALLRLREGVYGNCEVCDKKIPIERLNALPYTTVCVGCQRELETNPELREELENRHERELARLGEEDDDEEYVHSDEDRDRETEREEEVEEEQETRRDRRRAPAMKQPAAKSTAKPTVAKTVSAKPAAKTPPKLPAKTPMKPAQAKTPAKPTSAKAPSKPAQAKASPKSVKALPVKMSKGSNGKHASSSKARPAPKAQAVVRKMQPAKAKAAARKTAAPAKSTKSKSKAGGRSR
jgi:DnaK suppressor protein